MALGNVWGYGARPEALKQSISLSGQVALPMEMRSETTKSPRGLERVFQAEALYGNLAKWGLLLASALVLWLWRGFDLDLREGWSLDLYALVLYAGANLLFTLVFLSPRFLARCHLPTLPAQVRRVFLTLSYLADYLYVAVLTQLTGGPQSDFYLLFALLALKSAIYYSFVRELVFISLLSGFLWILASYQYAGSLAFLVDRGFTVRYGTLFLLVVGCMLVGWLTERWRQSISTLDANLSSKSNDLENQTHIVQRMANQLANRLLELRSLQESVKAINSALALDELLQRIVENAAQVLRGARCSIALVDDRRESVVTSAAAGIPRNELWGTSFRIGQGVAGWVVQNRRPVLINAVDADSRFRRVGQWPIASLVSVPLVSDNQVIGALTATSPDPSAFTEADVNLLDAFGDQAVVAVKNARLYEQLMREEKETARLYQSVLEKSNELEAILRGIGDSVIVIDPQLRLLMMNPIAARIFRVLKVPQPGVRLPEIVSNEALLALARDTLTDIEAPLIRELSLQGDGDRAQIYQALASPVRGAHDEVRGVVMVMRDITSQKEIERMKSDFLSVVSHELRTPLHSIKGFVDIILMGKTGQISDLQRDFLTTVKQSTASLQRLIDDLLEFSRMEAGQIKLRPQMISVYDVAAKVVEQLSPLAQEGKLALVNEVSEAVPLVEADPMRIEQVLTNLVSNAIKFTPAEGSVTIRAEDTGDQVRVSVKDTGIGIPEAEQGKVFERFYQVDSGATRSYRGAGLGLTICKFIVEYHHGRIWVESKPGEGSTFHFALPKLLPRDEALVIDFTIPAERRN
jgi:signal transduction histidine kinase